MKHEEHLRRAIELGYESMSKGGGPFGAVITRDGKVIAEAHNMVTINTDPTAHAEVQAIRLAARELGDFNLEGCTLYASCEPCPMCLGAIYWAHISRLYYASNRNDAGKAGFDDAMIYDEFARPHDKRLLPMQQVKMNEADELFREWQQQADKNQY